MSAVGAQRAEVGTGDYAAVATRGRAERR